MEKEVTRPKCQTMLFRLVLYPTASVDQGLQAEAQEAVRRFRDCCIVTTGERCSADVWDISTMVGTVPDVCNEP